jgi:pimeloyl-ACP methyl ester carboxylesterase
MPLFKKGQTEIYYEVHGSGYPLLLLPPGGMGATIDFWQQTPFNGPVVFSEFFRVIAIDQRNSGRSSGPIDGDDPWGMYLTDHLGLLNHLGIEQCHVLGCCIGASYALKMIEAAPKRIASAVLEQPIGITEASKALYRRDFEKWSAGLAGKGRDTDPAVLEKFRSKMWDGEFVLSVSREFVSSVTTPMLVLPGNNDNHPNVIGHEIAKLNSRADVIADWKVPTDIIPSTVAQIRAFLEKHTP